jgi:5-methylcytosine-specific restriction protein A
MNSLSSILSRLSSELGIELVSEENSANNESVHAVRFSGLDRTKSFSLVISRSWKTTQISFKADPFARDVVHFLCSQINSQSAQVSSYIDANELSFSSINLEIDGRPFFGSPRDVSPEPSLIFDVETLTPESSIQYGLFNSQEEKLLSFAVSLFASVLPVEMVSYRNADEVVGYPEGAVSQVLVNRYERDPRNRKAAISIHGKSCMACGFNFQERYGDLGDDYIVVHHTVPVSRMGENYEVNPEKDLVTLCANCHAMVHRHDPPLEISQLKQLLSN